MTTTKDIFKQGVAAVFTRDEREISIRTLWRATTAQVSLSLSLSLFLVVVYYNKRREEKKEAARSWKEEKKKPELHINEVPLLPPPQQTTLSLSPSLGAFVRACVLMRIV
jgi:hypothetical protein